MQQIYEVKVIALTRGLVDVIIFCSNNELQEIAQVLVPIYEPKYWGWKLRLHTTITNERLARWGYYETYPKHTSLCTQYDWTAVYWTVRKVVWEVICSTNGWPPTWFILDWFVNTMLIDILLLMTAFINEYSSDW